MLYYLRMVFIGLIAAFTLIIAALIAQSVAAQAQLVANSPTPPGHDETCAIVTAMPGASDTDDVLALLGMSRAETVNSLIAMKQNMEQYEAEGYGWQNAIDGSSALEPRPGSWLIGALRMACDLRG